MGTGWTDDRFMEAYDAIDGIIRDHATPEDKLPELRAVLAEIERCDMLLREIIQERAA